MKFALLLLSYSFLMGTAVAQKSFRDSTTMFIKNYVEHHEVVKGDDKKLLQFYQPDNSFRVVAQVERVEHGNWFKIKTSGSEVQTYRVYAVLHFRIHDTAVQLNLYQSQSLLVNDQYKNYLFLPFTDITTGVETYESGRYLDLTTDEILNNTVLVDFNKAYNPYCAYVSGVYHCPIPPQENHLNVAIRAGEKVYKKPISTPG